MNILIWFPRYQKGGGGRLFINLVSSLERHSGIEKIGLVLSGEYKNDDDIRTLTKDKNIQVYYYLEGIESDPMIEASIAHAEKKIAGFKKEITEIETHISKIQTEIKSTSSLWIMNSEKIFKIPTTRTLKRILRKTFYRKTHIKHIKDIIQKEEQTEKMRKGIDAAVKNIQQNEDKIRNFREALQNRIKEIKNNPVDYYADDYDVVYFFWPHFIDFYKTKKPSVCTFQDVIILDFPENVGGANARIFWETSKKWIEETTVVVTSSNYIKTRLTDMFGDRCNSITVVPHRGSPVEYYSNYNNFPLSRNLPSEYIVYPGNLGFHKNHYNLLIAYSHFKYRSRYPLVLFGVFTEYLLQEPPNYPELLNCARLVALIKRLGLKVNEDYYPLGYVKDEEVELLIKNAKALVMPSLAEGGGSYPVEEALRLGVPVACSDIPVMREHLEGRTPKIGWFDPESTDSIANALNEVIEHYDEYKSSTLRGIKDVAQTWDNIADRYVRVFEKAIETFKK